MPIIHVTTWPTPEKIKERLMEEITRVVHAETKAPLDKITVYITEIQPNSWAEAGILGSDSEFKTKSRRLAYEETKG